MNHFYFYLLLLIFLAESCCTIKAPPPPTLGETSYYKESYSKYSVRKRRKMYPFSKAAEVKLIYFEYQEENVPIEVIEISDSLPLPIENSLPPDTLIELSLRNVQDFLKKRVLQVVDLNQNQIDTLTDIIYNENFRLESSMLNVMGCYEPRNAILFIDKHQTVFAFLEICFECNGIRASEERIKEDARFILLEEVRPKLIRFFEEHGVSTK